MLCTEGFHLVEAVEPTRGADHYRDFRLKGAANVGDGGGRLGEVNGHLRTSELAVGTPPVVVIVNDGHNLVMPLLQHSLHDVAHLPVS